MDFPVIPESLTDLPDGELVALRDALTAAGLALTEQAKTAALSSDDLDNARLAGAYVKDIKGILVDRAAVTAELAEIADSLTVEPEVEAEPVAELAAEEPETVEEPEVEEIEEPEAVVASVPARRRATAATLDETAPVTPAPVTPDLMARKFKSHGGVDGYAAGDTFENMTDLGKALLTRYGHIRGGGSDKVGVAFLEGRFSEGATLAPGTFTPFDPFNPESIQAGLDCTPREPVYDVGCASSMERPFGNSLPNKKAPRGGYSVYSSPLLADVTDGSTGDGTGQWTRTDDANGSGSEKNACAIIPCGSTEDYDIYGVYRCLTVRNLAQMTFPELVAAYLNKLGALWARFAEVTLLDAAINSANVVDITQAANEDIGATVNILDTLVQVAAVYTEQERYADGLTWGIWLPRWVATLVIRDMLHAPRYNPTPAEIVATRSEINSAFRKAGFNVHWTMDSASTWSQIGTQTAGALEPLPTVVDALISPEGNFQRLDEGTLTVGVTNRSPWDKDDMARNQFTMFWESYEGIYDAGCPSYTLSIADLCPNGLFSFAPQDPADCVHGS